MSKKTGLGLVFQRDWKLAYGFNHGFGIVFGRQWLPDKIQMWIVKIMNPILCRIFGHSLYIPGRCTSCCKTTDAKAYRDFQKSIDAMFY